MGCFIALELAAFVLRHLWISVCRMCVCVWARALTNALQPIYIHSEGCENHQWLLLQH